MGRSQWFELGNGVLWLLHQQEGNALIKLRRSFAKDVAYGRQRKSLPRVEALGGGFDDDFVLCDINGIERHRAAVLKNQHCGRCNERRGR